MAPKRSKNSKSNQSSDDEKVDSGASSSAGYNNINLDAVIEKLASMSLEDKQKMEKNMSDDVKTLVEKLKAVKSNIRQDLKEKNKETAEDRKKQKAEERKQLRKAEREVITTFFVRFGSFQVEIRVPLTYTIGKLRRRVAEMLNVTQKVAKKLTLTLDGIDLTTSPRKTLYGFNIRQGGVITAVISEEQDGENSESEVETSDDEMDLDEDV